MNRIAQGLTLVLLGSAALSSTLFSDLYLNWVKPVFGPFLIAAGVVMAILGALVIAAELRGEGSADPDCAPGHGHERAPGVAWLLLAPVVAVFVVAPPALGSYTVERDDAPAAPPEVPYRGSMFDDGLDEAAPGEAVDMDIRQFVMRAWVDEERAMAGREIELTGFAVPTEDGQGWYLARLQMACCAADAIVNKVLITNTPAPDKDSWWTVRGTWVEPEGDLVDVAQHEFHAVEQEAVQNPPDPYEG
ncbi:TIGR03943 family putative permease subunit [Nocardiopsis sp. CNT312]|uniref:TIGR03943 family putative permease subunit n=1 Tax=Nocardiopsis sp. CNT312 TaxID=1137268 RepID=UPI00048CA178|nr:TIGR03943 family protein [Nocardiopsis sp. CNT312]